MVGLKKEKGRLLTDSLAEESKFMDGETRKILISNSQETHPKPEQPTVDS